MRAPRGSGTVILLPVHPLLMFTVVRPALATAVRAADRRGTSMSALFPLLVAMLMNTRGLTRFIGVGDRAPKPVDHARLPA
jgi:hypothetical protein